VLLFTNIIFVVEAKIMFSSILHVWFCRLNLELVAEYHWQNTHNDTSTVKFSRYNLKKSIYSNIHIHIVYVIEEIPNYQ
jgi:hypothetical protein